MSRLLRFRRPAIHAVATAAALAVATPGIAWAADREGLGQIGQQVRNLLEKARPSVVRIIGTDRHGTLSGTGFAIDPRGVIYTSYSVGGTADNIVAQVGDRKYPARRLVGDSRSGIALLKIDAETPFLVIGESAPMKVGDPVVAIGYPMDLPLSPSLGLIAGFDLNYLGRFFATTHIRASVPVQRGEGGAPLLDIDGNVIGILISSLDGSSGCFALPIEAAEKVRSDYMRFGDVHPGWLGIDVGEAHESTSGSVARVKGVIAESPAAKGNLRAGDTILQVGKVPVTSPADVLNASFFLTAGDTIPIFIARNGQTMRVQVEADMPRTEPAENLLNLSSPPTREQAGLRFETR